MGDLSGVRMVGPLAPLADGFRRELAERGYSRFTAVGYVQLMGHLSRWLDGRRGAVAPLTVSVVEEYLEARRGVGYRSFLTC